MPKKVSFSLGVFLALSLSQFSRADHGREFLTLQDAHVGSVGGGSFALGGDWKRQNSGDEELGLEGTLMLPVVERLALGLSASMDDANRSFGYSGISPHLMLDITPKQSPIRFSLMVGYQFAEAAAENHHSEAGSQGHSEPQYINEVETVSVTTPATEPHAHGPVQCGPEYGPDAPPCEATAPHDHGSTTTTRRVVNRRKVASKTPHEHASATAEHSHAASGTHQHGSSGWHARLIAEMDLTTQTKAVVNLVYFNPEDGKPALGYGVGLRQMLTGEIGVGVEAVGDFEEGGSHEIVLGSYISPIHDLTLKVGVGLGLTEESPDLTARLGVVLRF